jgi:aspartate aminotransferase
VVGLEAVGAGDFAYIARERGMFSFLGLTTAQVERLRSEFSIYLVDSSRINVAGLNTANLPYVCEAIAAVAV